MLKKRSIVLWLAVLLLLLCLPAGAATSVDAVIEQTWSSIRGQIQNVVNNVVFPAVDMILAVVFFVKLSSAYFDYRKHGQFDFTAPAILFACLVFTLTAPLYIWKVLGI
ncbi:DUF3852 domain-containing protein [Anaeromassilibacillus sp. SJQ-5]